MSHPTYCPDIPPLIISHFSNYKIILKAKISKRLSMIFYIQSQAHFLKRAYKSLRIDDEKLSLTRVYNCIDYMINNFKSVVLFIYLSESQNTLILSYN